MALSFVQGSEIASQFKVSLGGFCVYFDVVVNEMTYLGYVIAAYCIFGAMLLWDYLQPRVNIRRQLARLRKFESKQHSATKTHSTGDLPR